MFDVHVPLILASSSPRRRDLLRGGGFQFSVIPPVDVDETELPGETPEQLVARLARAKAASVAQRTDGGLVLGCDSVVECGGRILGKPRDLEHARQILGSLVGREHRVLTGLCLWPVPEGTPDVRVAQTRLVMDPLSPAQLEQYLASGQWEGKAGAFGYQDGLDWVRVLEGSETNVVGLSMELLAEMLAALSKRQ
ncbi:MAG: Maf family protein [Patescibacteria group bacterium]|nr:Maf family protein [Patescibacteria group bacterium]